MDAKDDSSLLRSYVAHRDEESFRMVADRYASLVYGTCVRRLGRRDIAEDATQVVFIALAREARSLASRHSLAPWLYATANNVAKNMVRQEARRMKYEQLAHPRDEARPIHEIMLHLDDALAVLRREEREAIVLRYMQGFSLADVGAALGISEDAARMRVKRSLDSLRRELGKIGFMSPAAEVVYTLENASPNVPQGLLESLAHPERVLQLRPDLLARKPRTLMTSIPTIPLVITVVTLTLGLGTGGVIKVVNLRIDPSESCCAGQTRHR